MIEFELNGETYELISEELRIAITYLLKLRAKLGIDDDTQLDGKKMSDTLTRYVLEIYRVWGALFPEERKEFINNTKYELSAEKPVRELIKGIGYSPTSFPSRFHNLMSVLLPSVKMQDKRFWKTLFSHLPELKRSNYA